ncbi:MAG: polynucleotide adenylyltransferase PcnB [Planctomycetota bacterium]|nr:polynucleotide adenylyltransferase PcnB [Planctomycetota bacterium]MCX8040117.1 polynucleotide adenylyltransferase PcnB [Planctomycetota bacterium]MDW8373425.1 polynucleotide adenylyltransferase PcnB [Planctomycetota bacterium]
MPAVTEPRIIPRAEHPISRADIDKEALRILYRLKDAGYQAYLVGGAVRDLLMGRCPKDFDVATDARPREVRRLFRNSREVGKRFRIVHVYFGPKHIEVSTLRSAVDPPEDPAGDRYIADDNQWGDIESDAFRRDFTINALYYDIRDFSVIDYVGGVEDIAARRLRCIGDPRIRFQEDPVRMLRAVKFAARYGYRIDPAIDAAIREFHQEIHKANRHRVTEEFFRILSQANRCAGLRLLADFQLLSELYPEWLATIGEEGLDQVAAFLAKLDEEAEQERWYSLEVLVAGLFVPMLGTVDLGRESFNPVAERVTREVRQLGLRMDLPKRLINGAVELLRGQLYLLFFAHRESHMRRFVRSPWFDSVWRLHLLAFGELTELAGLRRAWLHCRRQLGTPIAGTVPAPDRRDIFSFRGRGGGRLHGAPDEGGPEDDEEADDEGSFSEPEIVESGE